MKIKKKNQEALERKKKIEKLALREIGEGRRLWLDQAKYSHQGYVKRPMLMRVLLSRRKIVEWFINIFNLKNEMIEEKIPPPKIKTKLLKKKKKTLLLQVQGTWFPGFRKITQTIAPAKLYQIHQQKLNEKQLNDPTAFASENELDLKNLNEKMII